MTTFKELSLNSEIIKSLNELGFVEPSSIQEKTIPFILKSKKDLIALAQTGTGKTAAFGLPILNQISERNLESIILCPTRELCIQLSEDIKKFSKYSKGISITPVYGGERIDIQIRSLKKGTNIVIGTPGRVHDLIRRKVLNLQHIKWLVLDEADEMLDMGFKDDLDAILEKTPKTKRTFLFSATISRNVHFIAKQYMRDAEEISAGEKNVGAEKVSHEYYVVQNRDRFEALQRILDSLPGVYGILFCRTRNQTQEIADKLKQAHYDTDALHGDIPQSMRIKIMDRFKRKQVRLLVATDVAARGIDVSDLSHVINYNLPDQNELYTHRSGRTGRANKSGISISILSPRDTRRVKELENTVSKKFEYKKIPNREDICKKQIDNFIKEIEETDLKDVRNEQYFIEFIERLKKINKEDLIKHFIANKFSYFMDAHKNANDLNASAPDFSIGKRHKRNKCNANLEINFGKRHRFDVKALFGLINSNKDLKGIDVGGISLLSECSVFSVEKNCVDRIIRCLKGTNFRGKSIDIKISNKTVERRERSFSGGKRKRKNFRRTR